MPRGGKREGAGRKPGSLNKATADIREAAQVYTDEALQVLASVMRGDFPAAARVSAAQALLDRGHGKPAQSVELDATMRTLPAEELSEGELLAIAAGSRAGAS